MGISLQINLNKVEKEEEPSPDKFELGNENISDESNDFYQGDTARRNINDNDNNNYKSPIKSPRK